MERYNARGVPKKKDDFSPVGSVFLLQDNNLSSRKTSGRTSHNANHHHKWNVDANGNGYTTLAVHPDNPNIKHRHKIVNFKVQEAKSGCYPNCEEMHGVSGAPPHIHGLSPIKMVKRFRTEAEIANKVIKSFNSANGADMQAPNQQQMSMTPVAMPRRQATQSGDTGESSSDNMAASTATGGNISGY